MSTALSKAVAGEKVPDSKKTGVLSEALDKLKSMGGRITKAKEMSETLADAVIATAETQGTVFAASFAEGYFGEEKMDVGPVDLRLGGGLVVGGYGLYKTMTGKGGSHALAIGNGLLATGIGRIGRSAGKALAEKKGAASSPPAQVPAGAPAPVAAPVPAQLKGDDIGEIARMVRMTPGTEGEDVAGRHRRREGREGRSDRFIRARA
ncbi:MAG: hypothetical protein Q8P41_13265 [Pseudomonadota bacterium]|nr:hypothetical protein [Pseudomonadota bacterium]